MHAKTNQFPARQSKPNHSLDAFFKRQAPLNPSTVTAPPPIHAVDALAVAGPNGSDKGSISEGRKICPKATRLLQDLEAAAKQILDEVPMATQEHPLSIFAVDPHTCIAEPGKNEGDWPTVNGMLKTAFGWGEAEMAAAIPNMLN
jgi:hypothetical protein